MTIASRKQALPLFTGIVVLIGLAVVLQLWLLGASLEGVLTGNPDLALFATIASTVLFAGNGALLAFVVRVDRRSRQQG